jgi:hypothetical protein
MTVFAPNTAARPKRRNSGNEPIKTLARHSKKLGLGLLSLNIAYLFAPSKLPVSGPGSVEIRGRL